MSFIVLPKSKVSDLVTAANHLQKLMNDGIVGNAFCGEGPEHVHETVTAFDRLNAASTELAAESKIASPFVRYRREILGQYETAGRLRALVLNLYGGAEVNLSHLFWHADEQHTRIALECIVSYTQYGENDTFFMTLASEIMEKLAADTEAIANGLMGDAA